MNIFLCGSYDVVGCLIFDTFWIYRTQDASWSPQGWHRESQPKPSFVTVCPGWGGRFKVRVTQCNTKNQDLNDPHHGEVFFSFSLSTSSTLVKSWNFSIPCVKMLPSGKQKTTTTLQKLNHQSWKTSRVHHLPSKKKHRLLVIRSKMKELTQLFGPSDMSGDFLPPSMDHETTLKQLLFSTPAEETGITIDGLYPRHPGPPPEVRYLTPITYLKHLLRRYLDV